MKTSRKYTKEEINLFVKARYSSLTITTLNLCLRKAIERKIGKRKMKYYTDESKSCDYMPLSFWKKYFKKSKLILMTLREGIPDNNSKYFFCRYFWKTYQKTDNHCGKKCQYYKPRNGKSGICFENRISFIETETFIYLRK